MAAPNPADRRIKFDGTVNLGHILTFLGFLISGFIAWSTMDKRVLILEEARIYQQTVDRKQDEERASLKQQTREDYKEINRKLDRMLDRALFKTEGK